MQEQQTTIDGTFCFEFVNEEKINQLTSLLDALDNMVSKSSDKALKVKPDPNKWSVIEIVGHLVDSALHNLVRYNELISATPPYAVRPYKQEELVAFHQYQSADIKKLINLLMALNQRVIHVYSQFNSQILETDVDWPDGVNGKVQDMVTDYVNHFENHFYHIRAILELVDSKRE